MSASICRIDHLPFVGAGTRSGQPAPCPWLDAINVVADVGLAGFGEHLRRAAVDVDRSPSAGFVAAAAVEGIKRGARNIESDELGRQRILGRNLGERRHLLPAASRSEHFKRRRPVSAFAAMRNARLSSTTKALYPSSFLNSSVRSPVLRL